MKIIYIANARIPTEKAHGIHIMKMCESFALGNEVELVLPRRLNKIKDDPFSYYGIGQTFKIKKLPCLDLIPFCKYLGNFGLWTESATFFFSTFIYTFFKKADIIYTRNKCALPLCFFKKNLILELHTFPRNKFLYQPFFKKIAKIVVITHQLKTLFIEKGMAPDKILVAPDGVDLEKFDIKDSRETCRSKLNLPQDKKIVLYAGHLYDWKGTQILVEASQYLPEDTRVYLVGGTEKDIEKYRKQNGGRGVQIVGHRPHNEIPCWLKAADVLVLPNSGKEEISRRWTSPLKMFEYMAARKPIVASDLLSIREILNEKNAILVESDDPKKLAEGIKQALQNQIFSDKISKQALEDVKQYTWVNRAKNILWTIRDKKRY